MYKYSLPFVRGSKKCTKCHKEKAVDIDNFYTSTNVVEGFTAMCRECIDDNEYKYVGEVPFTTCNRCYNDMPATSEHFYVASVNKSGFRQPCRECSKANSERVTIKNGLQACTTCFIFQDRGQFYRDKRKKRCDECIREGERRNNYYLQKIGRQHTVPVAPEGYKYCSKCERHKRKDGFGNSSKSKDGLRIHCKDCRKQEHLEYSERHKEKSKHRYQASVSTKEGREEIRARSREWGRKFRATAYGKMRTDQENHKRLAWARGVENNLSESDYIKTLRFFNESCAYCEVSQDESRLERDHLIPLSKQGGYTRENIVPACRRCNARKSNKDFEDWYIEYDMYHPDRFNRVIEFQKGDVWQE